jgi:hypothetical protein
MSKCQFSFNILIPFSISLNYFNPSVTKAQSSEGKSPWLDKTRHDKGTSKSDEIGPNRAASLQSTEPSRSINIHRATLWLQYPIPQQVTVLGTLCDRGEQNCKHKNNTTRQADKHTRKKQQNYRRKTEQKNTNGNVQVKPAKQIPSGI